MTVDEALKIVAEGRGHGGANICDDWELAGITLVVERDALLAKLARMTNLLKVVCDDGKLTASDLSAHSDSVRRLIWAVEAELKRPV